MLCFTFKGSHKQKHIESVIMIIPNTMLPSSQVFSKRVPAESEPSRGHGEAHVSRFSGRLELLMQPLERHKQKAKY